MPRILEIAIRTAVTRRGVAVIVLPGNIAWRDAGYDQPRLLFPEPTPEIRPSDGEIATLARMLNEARRITILGGCGCASAHAELVEAAGEAERADCLCHAGQGVHRV